MQKNTDVLNEEAILPHLATRLLGRRVLAYGSASSTNDIALEVGATCVENPDGTLVVAEYQTRGRGRFRRKWLAPPQSNLLFTLILNPPIPLATPPLLTLAMGISVEEAIRMETGLLPRLKWPNDVVLNGRKVCGVLTESGKRPNREPFWIVGAGVNVNMDAADFPPELRDNATSLSLESGGSLNRAALLGRILGVFEGWYERLQRKESKPLLETAEWLSETIGTPIRVRLGESVVEGIATGFDDDGALFLRTAWGKVCRIMGTDNIL